MGQGWKNRIALLVLTAAISGCRTAEEKGPRPAAIDTSKIQLEAKTVVPASFQHQFRSRNDKALAIPPGVVRVAEVVRPRAEVRGGPGVEYPLHDWILREGARLLVYDSVGVWRKVIPPEKGRAGWVHEGVLSQQTVNEQAVTLPGESLPTVIAVKPIKTAWTFPEEKTVEVTIPKGTLFRTLRYGRKASLVWLENTNSLIWIDREEVR